METRCGFIGQDARFSASFISPAIGSSFTFLLLYWLLPRMSVTRLQAISLITPPGAIALGWAFGGERLSIWSLLGAAFVLLGVWMIFRRINEPRSVAVGAATTRG